jgi:hypothetical protein
LSIDFVCVVAPLYVSPRGFFLWLWPPFVDSADIDSLLYVDSRGFFMWLFNFRLRCLVALCQLYLCRLAVLHAVMAAFRRLRLCWLADCISVGSPLYINPRSFFRRL